MLLLSSIVLDTDADDKDVSEFVSDDDCEVVLEVVVVYRKAREDCNCCCSAKVRGEVG